MQRIYTSIPTDEDTCASNGSKEASKASKASKARNKSVCATTCPVCVCVCPASRMAASCIPYVRMPATCCACCACGLLLMTTEEASACLLRVALVAHAGCYLLRLRHGLQGSFCDDRGSFCDDSMRHAACGMRCKEPSVTTP